MVNVIRATVVKNGVRGEFERVLTWENGVTDVDVFAEENGFPNPLQKLTSPSTPIVDARVYAAASGVYPEFLLMVRSFEEWYGTVCWDIIDLYEMLNTFRLQSLE